VGSWAGAEERLKTWRLKTEDKMKKSARHDWRESEVIARGGLMEDSKSEI
jgi:hypothetical protein